MVDTNSRSRLHLDSFSIDQGKWLRPPTLVVKEKRKGRLHRFAGTGPNIAMSAFCIATYGLSNSALLRMRST